MLTPSLNFVNPNENVDWERSPAKVNTQLRPWDDAGPEGIRRGGVSAFGFGGTNFHVVLEEHVPGRHRPRPKVFASAAVPAGAQLTATVSGGSSGSAAAAPVAPLLTPMRGACLLYTSRCV